MFNFMRNRTVLIAIAIAGLVVIGLIIWAASSSKNPAAGPTPTPSPGVSTAATYTGTELLIARGASTENIENLKFALFRYSRDAKTVTITNVKHLHDSTDPVAMDKLVFDLTLDRKPAVTATLEYNDLTSARLVITKPPATTPIFDSGFVKVETDN